MPFSGGQRAALSEGCLWYTAGRESLRARGGQWIGCRRFTARASRVSRCMNERRGAKEGVAAFRSAGKETSPLRRSGTDERDAGQRKHTVPSATQGTYENHVSSRLVRGAQRKRLSSNGDVSMPRACRGRHGEKVLYWARAVEAVRLDTTPGGVVDAQSRARRVCIGYMEQGKCGHVAGTAPPPAGDGESAC